MYEKITLDNGLRLIIAPMPATRSVAINFFIGTGSRYEDDGEAGVSHFIEHMCFKGTAKHPTPIEISSVIEGVGGILNAGTDKELTVYYCKVAQPHFKQALDVMADILFNSKFEPGEMEKERQVIIEEINMSLDLPQARVSMLLDDIMWPGHPLGRDIAGSRESVNGITRELMLDYMAEQYEPENVVLAIAGAIDKDETIKAVGEAVAGWTKKRQPLKYQPYTEKPIGRRVAVEKRPSEQTQMCLALPGVSLVHPDRFKLDLLNIILGEGMSSRLFTEIRDKLGLAYSIQSYAEHFLDAGAMVVSAGVENKNVDVSIKAITAELNRLKEGIPEAEVNRAKELFKGRIYLRMEDSRSVASWTGTQEILMNKVQTMDEVIAKVNAVSVEDLYKIAKEYAVGEKLHLAAVGQIDPDKDWEGLLKI
ncbi:MAG: pitrilysin family protein [Dehalococcoidales bacterium]|nr:pitrilysin family protein [Dehalococcoidales bacterium]